MESMTCSLALATSARERLHDSPCLAFPKFVVETPEASDARPARNVERLLAAGSAFAGDRLSRPLVAAQSMS
jgi:hypothetical protein